MKTIITENYLRKTIIKAIKTSLKEQIQQNKDIIQLAIQKYGRTNNMRQAGYILPDGTLLNLGSDNSRHIDHRNIEGIYKENNINIWDDEYRYNYVVDFMNHGVIRCDVNCGLLDMTKEPTRQQYNTLKAFARYTDEIYVDLTDEKGNNIHSLTYDNPKPLKLINDIHDFYN